MRSCRLVATLLCALVLGWPAAAVASIIYHFSGTFQQQFGLAPAGLVGTAFSGSITYDPAAAIQASTANSITYGPGSASITLSTLFGAGTTSAGLGQAASRWDSAIASQLGGLFNPADEMSAGGSASYGGALSLFQLLSLQLLDGTGGAADDPFGAPGSPLPTTLDLAQMDSASVTLFAAGRVDGVLQTLASAVGRIECLSLNEADCLRVTQPVPEPSAAALLAAGLLLLASTRARRRPRACTPDTR